MSNALLERSEQHIAPFLLSGADIRGRNDADSGYPERYAQRALRQGPKIVPRACAIRAQGEIPALGDYEAAVQKAKKEGKILFLEPEASVPKVGLIAANNEQPTIRKQLSQETNT